MKKMKESIQSIIPPANTFNLQKVINRSDIQLHDVLVNGMRLNRFKAYQHPLPLLAYRPLCNELLDQQASVLGQENERLNNLFKNQQIKNRLKSVDKDIVSNLRIKTQADTPKKSQRFDLDGSFPKRSPLSLKKKLSDASAIINGVQPSELNRSNINLPKQLESSATTSKLGVVEQQTQRGKYVGLRVSRERRKTIEKDLDVDEKIYDRLQIKSQVERYKRIYLKKLQLEDSENKEQQIISIVKMPEKRQKKILKVCFSTRHKQMISTGINSNLTEVVNDALMACQ